MGISGNESGNESMCLGVDILRQISVALLVFVLHFCLS